MAEKQRRRRTPALSTGRWAALRIFAFSFFQILKYGVLAFLLVTAVWVLALRFIEPGGTYLMAREEARLGAISYEWRDLEDIAPDFRRAVVASEDARFCAHYGFDAREIEKALEAFESGRGLRGASTITQQTAKNLFLWPERSWLRKGLEAWFAALMELFWPKERILEVYLNIAEFGDGVFGAEAAAVTAFGQSADTLALWRASRLAVALPSPRRRDARDLSPGLAAQADRVADGARTLQAAGRDSCFVAPSP